MKTYAFGLEIIGRIGVRRPLVILVLAAAVTALGLAGIARLGFDDDLRSLLRSERENFQTYERFLSAFTDLENEVFLLLEADDVVTQERFEAVRNLHLDLQFIDGIASVVSIFTARHPPDANGDAEAVFPEDLPSGTALKALVAEASGHPLLGGKMLSPAADATLVVIGLQPGLREFGPVAATLAEIREAIAFATEATGLEAVLTGAPVLRHEILETIRSDLHVLNIFGALIAVTVCALLFRRPIWVVLASIAPIVGVIWTLGGMGLAGIPVTAMLNILPTLVLVIGFSDALHMVSAIRRLMTAGAVARDAVLQAVREVGPACAMTTVTTMIAMGSLAFSASQSVREFGLVGACAVFSAFVCVVGVVPALAIMFLPERVAPRRVVRARLMDIAGMASEGGWRLVRRAAPVLSVIGVVALCGAAYGFIRLEPFYDYREYLSTESVANQAVDRINAKLGGTDRIFVMVEGGGTDLEQDLAAVGAVHRIVAATPDIENAVSMTSVLEWTGTGLGDAAPEQLFDRLPEHYLNRLASADRDIWLVGAYIPSAPSPETKIRLAALDDALDAARRDHAGYNISITGLVPVSAWESGVLIDALKTNLTLAVIVIMALIALTSGSMMLSLFSALPNLLSLFVVAAALSVLGQGFQFTSAIALTVAFGIAVDNTVHFIHRYRLERRTLESAPAVHATMVTVGPVLIAATAVLALGLAVTEISALPMVVLFGRLCIVILLTALIATLLLLPALILVWRRKI